MKKFLDQSSWSRKAAIGSMLIMAFAFVGCDDSSSASAENNEPTTLLDGRDGQTYRTVKSGG